MKRNISQMTYIRVNDIFEELSEENKRLLNELMFANKCLNVLIKFKTFVDLVFNKLKTNFDLNDSQKFQELHKEVEEVFNEKENAFKDIKHPKMDPFSPNLISEMKELLNRKLSIKKDYNSDDNFKDETNVDSNKSHSLIKRREKTFLYRLSDCRIETQTKNDVNKEVIKPFKCYYTSCGKSFSSEQSLESHIRIGHKYYKSIGSGVKPIGKYKCDFTECDYETKIKKLFINHINHHKGIKPFVCDFISCGKSFVSEESLNCHKKYVHKNVRQYKCHFVGCDYESYNSNQFTNHTNAVHKGIRPFFCSFCDSQFGCKSYLRDHIRVVHESKPNSFKCDFEGCLKSFSDRRYLKNHYNYVHLKMKKTREKVFLCNEPGCLYKADCKAVLQIHRASHSDERPFECSYEGCSKSFKVKGSLKVHIEESHLGKTFKCEANDCNMTFTNRTTWKNHFNSQHSDKVLQCDWPGCDYSAKLERNLRKHKLVHKAVADYPCDWPECNKSFKSRAYLVQHLRIHNNDKRFICNWPGCNYRCAHSGNIHKHRRIHEKK